MDELLLVGVGIAILGAALSIALVRALRARARSRRGAGTGAGAPPPGPAAEPCWTEAIASDRRYRYGRAQCVDDVLMEADARMRREPPAYGDG
ncbi:MAG: hypothetical protein QOJ53_1298 [Sphingomonadales bacterium]|jgi:hypothetical protein|nr:hypothetical protein [Sphingomonadales bacterium]MEA3046966.1 hypothetical protein [Sphingomonadales bacterium]